MKNYKLAWRNLWRNRRRTMITAASVFFAVFFALLMRSMQLGTYGYLFKNIIESYSGYIQLQDENFWEDKIVDNVFDYNDKLAEKILADENITGVIPRFESFALASSGSRTKGVMVMGIDPAKESGLSDVGNKLVKYVLSDRAVDALRDEDIPASVKKNLPLFRGNSYATAGRLALDLGIKGKEADRVLSLVEEHSSVENRTIEMGRPGAMVGAALAEYLGLQRGDTIVLIGQGYHGAMAAGKFVVEGIVSLPAPDLESRIVYLPVDICQDLYAAYGKLTSLALQVEENDDRDIDQTITRLEKVLDSPYRLLGWREMNETIVQQMEADNSSGMIMIAILYLVIAFGVFGTVLMMTAERRREFGVIISIGMQKTSMAAIMVYEMLYIGLIGIAMGIIVALPTIIYGFYHPVRLSGEIAKMMEDYGFEPVMAFKWIDTYFLWQSVVVAIIVLLSVIYPVRKIMKLKEINALRA